MFQGFKRNNAALSSIFNPDKLRASKELLN